MSGPGVGPITEKVGKVEIKIGGLSFSAEGDQAWLSDQLAKVIEAASKIPAANLEQSKNISTDDRQKLATKSSLSAYLKTKSAEKNQVARFLATAAWLFRRGQTELTTRAISKALTDHHQKKLTNPADCLNQNCGKGYCEKTEGNTFYITPEGWTSLGEQQ